MKNRKHLSFSLITLNIFILLFLTNNVKAETDYYFKQISLQDGLSQSTVKCILNDYKGFIWIGTKSGLNRFDKNEIKSYFSKIEDTTSLPDDNIHFLAEDKLHNLWIGTEKGLTLYSRGENNFKAIRYNNQRVYANSFYQAKDRIIFGGIGLYEFNFETQQLQKIEISNKGEKLQGYIIYIHPWTNNKWVIGTQWRGIYLYDTQTHKISHFEACQNKNILAYYMDVNNNLWVSSYGNGIQCYSDTGKLTANYNTSTSSISSNMILDIKEKDDNIWLATDGNGICIFNPQKRNFTVIEHIPGDNSSFPVNSILCLYKDKEDNMWAGTIRDGLIGIREVYMKTFGTVPINNPYGLSEKAIISLYEDRDKNLWIGTDGGGLNVMNQQKNTFKHYPSEYKNKVTSITQLTDKELIISLFGKGLFVFNKTTGTSHPFPLANKGIDHSIKSLGISVNISKISSEKLLILADKVYIYNLKKKIFIKVINTNLPKEINTSVSSLKVISLNEYNTYLVGKKNIFKLNNKTNTLSLIYNSEQNTSINDACKDNSGRYWIVTTRGLICYDPTKKQTQKIETQLFHEASAIVYDHSNRLWIGGQGMLFVYIINENRFASLGESDGALPNEYLSRSTLVSSSGDIYMGGANGLLKVKKEITFMKNINYAIKLMDILLDGVTVNNKISNNSTIKISWHHSSLVLKVMSKGQDIFRKKLFHFTISGASSSNIISYDHTLTMHSLPPGKYEITASCDSQDGSWNIPTKILTIIVTPPWWKTIWFISICIILLIAGILLTIHLIIRQKENKLKWKMKEHEQSVYEEKVRFLINISHELRTPLTLIYAPLKRLLDQNKLDVDTTEQLVGIYKQSKQMKNIINIVLDVRKMEVSQASLHMQPHLLNNWLSSIADDFKNEFKAKRIQLNYNFDQAIEEVVFDGEKCEIVFSNLLMNALKFSPSDTKVTIFTQLIDNKVRISVRDQGIGLGDVDTSKLFTRFYQGKHDRKGSGIGLSYAKMLIEMHKGQIGAISNQTGGATFYYELPVVPTPTDTDNVFAKKEISLNNLLNSEREDTPETETFSLNTYTALVVEDEPELCMFLKQALSDNFKTVYTAENGINALQIINQYSPDIVISDVMMPLMDGFTLCSKIKSDIHISHIPIILLTALGDQNNVSLGYKLGADAYLPKPFEIEFLQTLTENILKNREHIKWRYKTNTTKISPEELTFSNADENFLLNLNKLISDNLSNPKLNVKFLTEQLNISRTPLYTKVKAITGIGVIDFINKIKIEKAIYLLTQTNLSMIEISEMLGFSNQGYFSTAFKQATGYSPSKYKEIYKTPDSQL